MVKHNPSAHRSERTCRRREQDGGRACSTHGGEHDCHVRDVNKAALGTPQVCRVIFHDYEKRSVDFRVSQKTSFHTNPTPQTAARA